MAVDTRPDRVARVVHVDAAPLGDGGVINDLPTGHWPQFTKPAELGAAIVDTLA